MWPGIRFYLEHEWLAIRTRGRHRFVWKQRVLPYGIPISLFGVMWFFYLSGLGPGAIVTREGASLAYYVIGITAVVIYVYARVEWAERERRYVESTRR
jgi:bacteriorhodopsin